MQEESISKTVYQTAEDEGFIESLIALNVVTKRIAIKLSGGKERENEDKKMKELNSILDSLIEFGTSLIEAGPIPEDYDLSSADEGTGGCGLPS